jgi:prepilin peptidase CpaA
MHVGYDFAVLVAVFSALCATIDYRTKRIPNWLTMPAAVMGLAYSSLAPGGVGIGWSLAGFAVGLSLLMVPWLLGGGGMGDVKMLAALGAWLGPIGILVAFGLGSVLAAFGMVAVLACSMFTDGYSHTRKRYVATAVNGGGASGDDGVASAGPRKVRRVLPFAVPMAVSTWMVLAWMLMRASG